MHTETINCYSINELTDDTKEKALDKLRENWLDCAWQEFIYEDIKTAADIIGIDIENIYFSGFYSQGDGACFEGHYQHRKESVKNIKKGYPLDTELQEITKNLADLQRKNFYQIYASVKHSGHYYHKFCTQFWIEHNDNNIELSNDTIEDTKEYLRDFMQWMYSRLEQEYEFLISDETMIENCIANEYLFNIDGNLI